MLHHLSATAIASLARLPLLGTESTNVHIQTRFALQCNERIGPQDRKFPHQEQESATAMLPTKISTAFNSILVKPNKWRR